MKVLLSPAKSLDFDTPLPHDKKSQPLFLDKAEKVNDLLRKKSPKKLMELRSSKYWILVIFISSALTAVGSARAANKSINNLRIKKENFIAPILDRQSINYILQLLKHQVFG